METQLDLSDRRNDVKLRSFMFKKQINKEANDELFGRPTSIDRRNRKRTVPMSVLNMSMPRTGTMSMQKALNILGYKCYHSSVWFNNINDTDMWDQAMDAKFFDKGPKFTKAEWDSLLGDFSAISADPPAVAFAEELIEMYPEAKVILVERDIDSWFKSFSTTVTVGLFSPLMHRLSDWDPSWLGCIRDSHTRWVKGWFKAFSKEEMDKVSRQVYLNHYALVRRVTPPERLLEFKLEDGWKPVCEFLGKDVPNQPFPRVNDSEALWEQLGICARRGLQNALVRWGTWAGVAVLALALLASYLWSSN